MVVRGTWEEVCTLQLEESEMSEGRDGLYSGFLGQEDKGLGVRREVGASDHAGGGGHHKETARGCWVEGMVGGRAQEPREVRVHVRQCTGKYGCHFLQEALQPCKSTTMGKG